MDTTIVDERRGDAAAREALLDLSMGADRKSRGSERLREGNEPAVALAALDPAGRLAGTVRLWPVDVGNRSAALMLGPLAVDAALRGAGTGSALVAAGISRAAAQGWDGVVLVGDPSWYARFGFAPLAGLRMDGPASPGRELLGLELVPGSLAGASGTIGSVGTEAFRMAA
jgi:predicted N-acetyltransferase YhbS